MDLINKRVPVLLLTGYLGSGKTTLVNHILANKRGIRFAVIVNDIGEVNIDASLIEKGGVVGKKDGSLVALQNGCICCTLKMDLVEQIEEVLSQGSFDYVVIEASGICEPEPIARTICSIPQMGPEYVKKGIARLDCIVTVVDALRMKEEFDCGEDLRRGDLEEEDVERLLIEQIEFCNMVLLNKASEVGAEVRQRLRSIILELNPGVRIVECDYAEVELEKLLYTGLFDYGEANGAAGWVQQIERATTEEENYEAKYGALHGEEEDDNENENENEKRHEHGHKHGHEHGHKHGHEHGHENENEKGEAEEYGIGSFVYFRRQPFNYAKFDRMVNLHWPKSVIRAKGVCYFSDKYDMSYLFEQAGKQMGLREAGLWFATMPEEELMEMMRHEPGLVNDWDEDYGDRMEKIVFIGQKMDKEEITRLLDECLEIM